RAFPGPFMKDVLRGTHAFVETRLPAESGGAQGGLKRQRRQAPRLAGQPVAQPRNRFDGISFLFQLADLLPDRRAADAQPPAEGFSRDEAAFRFFQQFQKQRPVHRLRITLPRRKAYPPAPEALPVRWARVRRRFPRGAGAATGRPTVRADAADAG